MDKGRLLRVEPMQVERTLVQDRVVLSHKLKSNEVHVGDSIGRRSR